MYWSELERPGSNCEAIAAGAEAASGQATGFWLMAAQPERTGAPAPAPPSIERFVERTKELLEIERKDEVEEALMYR
jgi:hypothetical protein